MLFWCVCLQLCPSQAKHFGLKGGGLVNVDPLQSGSYIKTLSIPEDLHHPSL